MTDGLTEGSIYKKIIIFCFPLILGNLFQYLYSTFDLIIVGRAVGKTALAAVGVCEPIIAMLNGLYAGTSGGVGVIIAQAYGAKDGTCMKKAVHTSVFIGIAFGIVLQILMMLMTPLILGWIHTPEDTIEQAVVYLRTYSGGLMFTLLFNMIAGIINAIGNSKVTLRYLGIASVMNIMLDLIFVIPLEWGIFGAAFATMLSQLFACICATRYLVKCPETMCRLYLMEIRVDSAVLQEILRISIPSIVQNLIRCIANIFLQIGVNSFGSMAIAGYAIALKVEGILWLPLMSMNVAAATFTGQNIGAQKYDRAEKGMWVSAGLIGIFTLVASLGITVFCTPVVGFFNDNPDVIKFGVAAIMVYIPPYFIFAIYNALAGAITGAGKTMQVMIISLFAFCALRVALLVGVMKMKASFSALMAIFPVSWVVALVAVLAYIWRCGWKKQTL